LNWYVWLPSRLIAVDAALNHALNLTLATLRSTPLNAATGVNAASDAVVASTAFGDVGAAAGAVDAASLRWQSVEHYYQAQKFHVPSAGDADAASR
jgi:hypothetical protein